MGILHSDKDQELISTRMTTQRYTWFYSLPSHMVAGMTKF